MQGPTIEDRLQNTENLIKEMNAKFEDIASTKNSAKHELNKLVKTLTMKSDYNNNNTWALNENSETESEHTGNENALEILNTKDVNVLSSGDEDDCSNSSYDEETCNLNQKDLKQILKSMSKQQQKAKHDKTRQQQNYLSLTNQNLLSKNSTKRVTERGTFSNSRYEDVEIDEEACDPYYIQQEEIIDIAEEDDNHVNDQLYQNAKDSLQRTKILLMSSQKDLEIYNQLGYTEDNDVEIIEMNSNRVKNILRNKEKRKNYKQESYSDHNKQFMSEASVEESCESNQMHSSEIDESQMSNQRFLMNQTSRNHLNKISNNGKDEFDPNKYIHQTTSSGNLVLYDSVNGISNKSPRDVIDPHYIERNMVKEKNLSLRHAEDYDEVRVFRIKMYFRWMLCMMKVLKVKFEII